MERREEMREDAMEEGRDEHQKKMDIASLIMEARNAEEDRYLKKAEVSNKAKQKSKGA
jgi:hypothetical protein